MEWILWLFLAQALSGFPAMHEGTRLQIVSPDLLTVHGEAAVADGQLVLQTTLVPESQVRIIVSYGSNGNGRNPKGGNVRRAQGGSDGEAVLEIYAGVVAPGGEDILLLPDPQGPPVSLREFLEEERGIRLFILPPDEG